ncbi:fumarylacetoacetate hydrolase family protein [Halosquirtibacter xylanolyticus]|uniref:fumarylacetoacetate hydrolase family protein n=1 Tax=Halosquirtibacter xylanolyticus TaxID=3374599 RepID=UPI003748B021|nr:fumarylacetoacetate hydrolase family protein [Prolixibacteraceae bacterium]
MKIICIGRNYAKHIAELKNDVPQEPVFFLKPDSAILQKNKPFYIPDFTNEVHYEVEVLFRIGRLGKNISTKFAPRYYAEVGLGIDFTARDIQQDLKQKGLPWEKAKAFDSSAVLGAFLPIEQFEDINSIPFSLYKNGEVVQEGNTKDMIFNIDQLVAHTSKYMTLKIGDIIFSGTPEGVGKVEIGDRLQGYIGEQIMFDFMVK